MITLLKRYSWAVEREFNLRMDQYSYYEDPPQELVRVSANENSIRYRLNAFERLLSQLLREYRAGSFGTAQDEGLFEYVWDMCRDV
jgi:hypothetical protein